MLLTGAFTLGGVILTVVSTGLGALIRRRWATSDLEMQTRALERGELRKLRRECYANLLTIFNRSADDVTKLEEGIAKGRVPLLENVDQEAASYISQHLTKFEALDEISNTALVVAGDRVSGLIREVEDALHWVFAEVARGRDPKPRWRVYHQKRDALSEEMRKELVTI
ncbi:hypothetical protein RSA3_00420 [Microbacterium testaceum]|uniref:Uncharacterized protein n=1 Tax=Microbacterium testaceum TaxID=2033 RepID=A0A147FCT4_MICTE|nr:hypothetical protein RSA3_00420 [Microbacterium testaceum]